MNKKLISGLSSLLLLGTSTPSLGEEWTGDGQPFKYISSCELDLDKNGLPDMVILAETIQGRELIAILKEKKGLKAFSIWTGPASNGMHLRCEFAQFKLKEAPTASADEPGKVHKTNGAVIHLFKPESSQRSFYWDKSQFKEVSTGD
ncbi:hypothetical protein F0U61_53885 [Archangium violaceum]|uniref:hypothetical protein n=1 Tax=Archangium violaceum TaxID=83451 RepID=UPI002B2E2C99|nr:hypothetical protein F0U61_53885 [Archangium violaceum]